MTLSEQEKLIARAAANIQEPGDEAVLLRLARADPGFLARLRAAVEMERLLAFHGAQCGGRKVFADEVLARLDEAASAASVPFSRAVLRRIRPARWPALTALAAALALLVGGAWWWWAQQSTSVIFATVSALEAARWDEAHRPLEEGVSLGRQKLALEAGFASILFANRAEVVLEGPAELEIISGREAVLHRGNASVHAPPEAVGFVLRGPETRVIDLGTRFGMKVGAGGATEVHVLEGLVRAETSDGQSRELRQNEALRTLQQQTESIGLDTTGFLTSLPTRPAAPAGYVHWRFDEAETASCDGHGAGLAGGNVPGRLETALPGGGRPQRVPGVFGDALYFDGRGGHVATSFPGIGGAAARTVALWVKVPHDWSAEYGYALASWGNPSQEGGVWQISINPGDYGGPIGRLRVGTHLGYVVGTRDLRDGEWHHLAVVMYGAQETAGAADVATHVLLYVDGELEPAAAKSARAIATDVDAQHGARPLEFGRNISPHSTAPSDRGRFFRGAIDEFFLCDQALTQRQIRQLRATNTCDGLAP